MNTMMKQTLAKILGSLPWRKNWLVRKKQFAFWLLEDIIFTKKIIIIKHQFFDFCTMFYHILQICLNFFFFFNENYHKLNISMRLENFRARKHYYTLFYTFFFQIKIIICISHRLTFMKWITPIARRSMHIFLLISTPGAY